jgi:6-pyruvoyltetrahydropterin/6-carboxytetrahydropterin synthase
VTITSIKVKHNVEMAHRLFMTPGKCESIHGHSWQVELELFGEVNAYGLLADLDFGLVKSDFRGYLDETFDHRLLLNPLDPWAGPHLLEEKFAYLPGVKLFDGYGDPTTENMAACIGEWASGLYTKITAVTCNVWETRVNNATWSKNVATPS